MGLDNRLFDDLSKVASGAFSAVSGVREEVETRLREQLERVLSRMNVVTREEFDAVQAMAAKARVAGEALEIRVAALEAEITQLRPAPPAPGSDPLPAGSVLGMSVLGESAANAAALGQPGTGLDAKAVVSETE